MNIFKRILVTLAMVVTGFCTAQAEIKNPHTLLGFDPRVSYVPVARATRKTPVITVLGFPDPITMYSGKFDTKNTFTVTFAFHNNLAFTAAFNPYILFNSYRSINAGQELDGKTLLYVVVECYKKGYEKVDIFANSRGGGATISMLDMLSNPLEHFDTWELLGFTDLTTIEEIRAMVGKGRIFLAHPLMDQDIALRNGVNNKVDFVWPFFGSQCIKSSLYHSVKMLISCTTQYNPNYPTPLQIINRCIHRASWPYNITIALADNDEMIGHTHDHLLRILADYYPTKIKLVRGGKSHCDIKQLVKDFRLSLHGAQNIS